MSEPGAPPFRNARWKRSPLPRIPGSYHSARPPLDGAPMTTATTHAATSTRPFDRRTDETLAALEAGGQYKHLRMLESPMDAEVEIRGYGKCLCFCSNNYLGLANHPEVVEAGIEGLRRYGAGTASVRFICGTFEPHEMLEAMIARYMG